MLTCNDCGRAAKTTPCDACKKVRATAVREADRALRSAPDGDHRDWLSQADEMKIGTYFVTFGQMARSPLGAQLEQGSLYGGIETPVNPELVALRAQRRAASEPAEYMELEEEIRELERITARPTLGREQHARDLTEYDKLVENGWVSRRMTEILRRDQRSHEALRVYCGDEGTACQATKFQRLTSLFRMTAAGTRILRSSVRQQPHFQATLDQRVANILAQKRLDPITAHDLVEAKVQAKALFWVACERWNDTAEARKQR